MRSVLVVAAAILLAVPAAAQERPADQIASEPVAVVLAQEAAPAAQSQVPSLYVSPAQIDAKLAEQGASAQINQGFVYTVAAVAIGVIIALLLLD